MSKRFKLIGILGTFLILSMWIPRAIVAQSIDPNYPKRFYIHIDGNDFPGCVNDGVAPSNDGQMYDKPYVDQVVDYGFNLLDVTGLLNGFQFGSNMPATRRCALAADDTDPNRDLQPCGDCLKGYTPDFAWHVSDNPDISFLDRILVDYEGRVDVMMHAPELTESETRHHTQELVPRTYDVNAVNAALAYYDHPVVKGYMLGDELHWDDSPGVMDFENHIHATGKWTMVNNYPSDANNQQLGPHVYSNFVGEYMSHPSPGIFSVDHYVFNGAWLAGANNDPLAPCSARHKVFETYETIAEKALQQPLAPPTYYYVELNANVVQPNCTTLLTQQKAQPIWALKYQIFAGLIHGFKGFGYFRRDFPNNCSSSLGGINWWSFVKPNDKLYLKDLHESLDRHSEVLMNLVFENVFHVTNSLGFSIGSVPAVASFANTNSAWSNFFTNPIANGHFAQTAPFVMAYTPGSALTLDDLAVSFLHDHKGGEYFWVFNKNTLQALDFEAQFNAPKFLLNVLDDDYCTPVLNSALISLAPGEGKLFQVQSAPTALTCSTYVSGEKLSYLADQVLINMLVGCPLQFADGSLAQIKTNATDIGGYFLAELGSDVTITSITPEGYCGVNKRVLEEQEAETAPANFKLFPNPNSGEFQVEWTGKGEGELFIFDAHGAMVHQQRLVAGVHPVSLKSHQLSAGVYFARINGQNDFLTQRFVVQ